MGDNSEMGSKGHCAHHIPLDRICDACLVWAAGQAPAIEREALRARATAAEQRVAILLECDTANRTEMVRADAEIGELRARVASLEAIVSEVSQASRAFIDSIESDLTPGDPRWEMVDRASKANTEAEKLR